MTGVRLEKSVVERQFDHRPAGMRNKSMDERYRVLHLGRIQAFDRRCCPRGHNSGHPEARIDSFMWIDSFWCGRRRSLSPHDRCQMRGASADQ